jgi:hypothetical protein
MKSFWGMKGRFLEQTLRAPLAPNLISVNALAKLRGDFGIRQCDA